jgi:hypothetical protein
MKARWLLVTCAIAGSANAQTSPESVARTFFQAEAEGRWLDAARLLDLNAFALIRDQSLSYKRARALSTADDYMRSDPAMPRVVAEYFAKRANEYDGTLDFLARDYAHVPSLDSLKKLSAEDAAARWLEARSPAWQEQASIAEAKRRGTYLCGATADSLLAMVKSEAMFPRTVIVGSTTPRDSASYVLVAMDDPTRKFGGSANYYDESLTPGVLTLRRFTAGWRIVPMRQMPHAYSAGAGAMFGFGCSVMKSDTAASK